MKLRSGSFVLVCVLASACTDTGAELPDAAPAGVFSFDGNLEGVSPSSANIAIIWIVSEGADYAVKFGGGAPSGTEFHVSFSTEPPGDALSSEGWGFGYLALVTRNITDSTRFVDDADIEGLFASTVGFAKDHAVVYRGPSSTPSDSWAGSFPTGFSCGACRRAEDVGLDTLATTDCATVKLAVGTTWEGGCNLD